jgi:ankyrin repeat protein
MKAADEGSVPVLQLLISAGADVNVSDSEGETALDKAIDEGNMQAAQVLRAAGAR